MELDIDMPADLDQFGGDNSHGTVIGWKSFVQLGHDATNGRRFFHEMNIKAGICQIQGRLHACDATAYNHYSALDILSCINFHY
jgi:hypothetical protein